MKKNNQKRQNEAILVSITTVAFNSAQTIARTIESVLNQTYENIEYIIVDGASTDDTVKIAKNYEQNFKEKGYIYKIISEPDNGMYDAINKGIRNAAGKIIGNINSDDWYELDAVEKVVSVYKETDFDFFYADLRMIYSSERTIIKPAKKCSKIITSRKWNHPTQFATKEFYMKEPYKCQNMHDDLDVMIRAYKKGYHVEVLNEVLANFTMEGMSHKREIKASLLRCRWKYEIYRNNGCSRLYFIECFMTELIKLILK